MSTAGKVSFSKLEGKSEGSGGKSSPPPSRSTAANSISTAKGTPNPTPSTEKKSIPTSSVPTPTPPPAPTSTPLPTDAKSALGVPPAKIITNGGTTIVQRGGKINLVFSGSKTSLPPPSNVTVPLPCDPTASNPPSSSSSSHPHRITSSPQVHSRHGKHGGASPPNDPPCVTFTIGGVPASLPSSILTRPPPSSADGTGASTSNSLPSSSTASSSTSSQPGNTNSITLGSSGSPHPPFTRLSLQSGPSHTNNPNKGNQHNSHNSNIDGNGVTPSPLDVSLDVSAMNAIAKTQEERDDTSKEVEWRRELSEKSQDELIRLVIEERSNASKLQSTIRDMQSKMDWEISRGVTREVDRRLEREKALWQKEMMEIEAENRQRVVTSALHLHEVEATSTIKQLQTDLGAAIAKVSVLTKELAEEKKQREQAVEAANREGFNARRMYSKLEAALELRRRLRFYKIILKHLVIKTYVRHWRTRSEVFKLRTAMSSVLRTLLTLARVHRQPTPSEASPTDTPLGEAEIEMWLENEETERRLARMHLLPELEGNTSASSNNNNNSKNNNSTNTMNDSNNGNGRGGDDGKGHGNGGNSNPGGTHERRPTVRDARAEARAAATSRSAMRRLSMARGQGGSGGVGGSGDSWDEGDAEVEMSKLVHNIGKIGYHQDDELEAMRGDDDTNQSSTVSGGGGGGRGGTSDEARVPILTDHQTLVLGGPGSLRRLRSAATNSEYSSSSSQGSYMDGYDDDLAGSETSSGASNGSSSSGNSSNGMNPRVLDTNFADVANGLMSSSGYRMEARRVDWLMKEVTSLLDACGLMKIVLTQGKERVNLWKKTAQTFFQRSLDLSHQIAQHLITEAQMRKTIVQAQSGWNGQGGRGGGGGGDDGSPPRSTRSLNNASPIKDSARSANSNGSGNNGGSGSGGGGGGSGGSGKHVNSLSELSRLAGCRGIGGGSGGSGGASNIPPLPLIEAIKGAGGGGYGGVDGNSNTHSMATWRSPMHVVRDKTDYELRSIAVRLSHALQTTYNKNRALTSEVRCLRSEVASLKEQLHSISLRSSFRLPDSLGTVSRLAVVPHKTFDSSKVANEEGNNDANTSKWTLDGLKVESLERWSGSRGERAPTAMNTLHSKLRPDKLADTTNALAIQEKAKKLGMTGDVTHLIEASSALLSSIAQDDDALFTFDGVNELTGMAEDQQDTFNLNATFIGGQSIALDGSTENYQLIQRTERAGSETNRTERSHSTSSRTSSSRGRYEEALKLPGVNEHFLSPYLPSASSSQGDGRPSSASVNKGNLHSLKRYPSSHSRTNASSSSGTDWSETNKLESFDSPTSLASVIQRSADASSLLTSSSVLLRLKSRSQAQNANTGTMPLPFLPQQR